MMDPDGVRTREDLAAFVIGLRDEFEAAGSTWENQTLDRFLEALARWLVDLDGWYAHREWCAQDTPGEGSGTVCRSYAKLV